MSNRFSPNVENMPPYGAPESVEAFAERVGLPVERIIKLDANENPYGPPQAVLAALADACLMSRYPDPEYVTLRRALSAFTGAPFEQLLPGNGADELIDLVMRVLLQPGDVVFNFPPSFVMYDHATGLSGGQLVNIPRRPDFSLDMAAVRQAAGQTPPRVIFLTQPNNPDGSLASDEEIDALLSLGAVLILDEAYIEFSGPDFGRTQTRIREVSGRENLIVLRTFSKWAGLAGMRVGYGAFPAWLMPALWKAKHPFNVNAAGAAAAMAALVETEGQRACLSQITRDRERMVQVLQTIPQIRVYPSETNFLLIRFLETPMPAVKQAFDQAGILVRWPGALKDCLRLTVGVGAENRAVMEVFAGLFQLQSLDMPDDGLPALVQNRARTAQVTRKTRETQIVLAVDLDGSGSYDLDSGLPFLDHMLAQIAVHGLFDLNLAARGDLEIDPHHTVEDIGLALGEAFRQALGDRKGIVRAASSDVPMDESLARVVVDFSGRPYAVVQVNWNGPQVGGLPVSLIAHFLESFAIQARCNLHVQVFYGRDDHHQCEAIFKALARALDAATRLDPRRAQTVPSSKGVLF